MRVSSLQKSIRVAGLHPKVTVEELNKYVVENTPINDPSKFRTQLLVKKDQDLSKLTYVSFKIDVALEDFESLMNMES